MDEASMTDADSSDRGVSDDWHDLRFLSTIHRDGLISAEAKSHPDTPAREWERHWLFRREDQ